MWGSSHCSHSAACAFVWGSCSWQTACSTQMESIERWQPIGHRSSKIQYEESFFFFCAQQSMIGRTEEDRSKHVCCVLQHHVVSRDVVVSSLSPVLFAARVGSSEFSDRSSPFRLGHVGIWYFARFTRRKLELCFFFPVLCWRNQVVQKKHKLSYSWAQWCYIAASHSSPARLTWKWVCLPWTTLVGAWPRHGVGFSCKPPNALFPEISPP